MQLSPLIWSGEGLIMYAIFDGPYYPVIWSSGGLLMSAISGVGLILLGPGLLGGLITY